MKLSALLFLAIAGTGIATSPLPSNTHIRINTEPRLAISKSRVSSILARSPILPVVEATPNSATTARAADAATNTDEHAALHYLSNDIRDASSGAVRETSGTRGMSKRSERVAAVNASQRNAKHVSERRDDVKFGRSGMSKARRARARAEREQEKRDPKFLSARW